MVSKRVKSLAYGEGRIDFAKLHESHGLGENLV